MLSLRLILTVFPSCSLCVIDLFTPMHPLTIMPESPLSRNLTYNHHRPARLSRTESDTMLVLCRKSSSPWSYILRSTFGGVLYIRAHKPDRHEHPGMVVHVYRPVVSHEVMDVDFPPERTCKIPSKHVRRARSISVDLFWSAENHAENAFEFHVLTFLLKNSTTAVSFCSLVHFSTTLDITLIGNASVVECHSEHRLSHVF